MEKIFPANSQDIISGYVFSKFADFRFESNPLDVHMNNLKAVRIFWQLNLKSKANAMWIILQDKLFDGAIIFVSTDNIAYFAELIRGSQIRYILITHNSDRPVTDDYINLFRLPNDVSILKTYARNMGEHYF
jgi:hypothetical protein